MKTKSFIFLCLIMGCLVFSCSKDSLINPDQNMIQNQNGAYLKVSGSEVQVYPGGTDDTQAFIDAFEQAEGLGNKAVVKLMPGTFRIGMIEVKEFNGTLSGSGIGSSIITNLSDLSPDDVLSQNKLPALITFLGGDVKITDLSVRMSSALPWLGQNEMSMLLFSDYSADFVPAIQKIKVNINNVEVTGILQPDFPITDWDGNLLDIVDYPYTLFNGVKLAPDMLQAEGTTYIPRSNIDVTVSNSNFSNFDKGVYVHGCKSGNLWFGTEGVNDFSSNVVGLCVNENIGVNVKIMNNTFTIPDWFYVGVDLNVGEAVFGFQQFEDLLTGVGTYLVRDNIFNIYYSNGFGIWDSWRYLHPDHQGWMVMKWENNTFNALADGAWMGINFGLKEAVFLQNKIVGDATGGYMINLGTDCKGPDDPYCPLTVSEGCKYLNNYFLQKDFVFQLYEDTKDYLVMGDLSNVIVDDNGINNRFIGKTNPGHANPASAIDRMKRVERMLIKNGTR